MPICWDNFFTLSKWLFILPVSMTLSSTDAPGALIVSTNKAKVLTMTSLAKIRVVGNILNTILPQVTLKAFYQNFYLRIIF